MSSWLTRSNGRHLEFSPVHSLFQSMMDDMWDNRWGVSTNHEKPQTGFSPKINIKESETGLQISSELPGLDEKDIEIAVDPRYVTISGEKKIESHKESKGSTYYECSYGSFSRKIPLPFEVNLEKVDATFNKGLLQITLEKADAIRTQTRKIPIKTK
jgi:HSP20 family protein